MGGETGGKGESFHQRPAAAHLLEAMSSGLLGWALEPARHRHGHGHRYLVCLSDELVVHSDPRPHHSSVLAWRIPGTGEPGGLPSMGSHRVIHD